MRSFTWPGAVRRGASCSISRTSRVLGKTATALIRFSFLRRCALGTAPGRNDPHRREAALDRLGRAPVAPAEVVGAGDQEVSRDPRQEIAREVPRGQSVVDGG